MEEDVTARRLHTMASWCRIQKALSSQKVQIHIKNYNVSGLFMPQEFLRKTAMLTEKVCANLVWTTIIKMALNDGE